ncbi:MCP four helix bundle domain-containing protein, partial [Bacillus sp. UMB0728]
MSFRKKQFLGFGIIMLFVAAILFLTVYFMNGMRSNLREITEDRYEKVKTAGEIRQGFTQSDQVILQLINSEKAADAESKERIEENRNAILQGIAFLEDRLNREEARDLLTQIQIEYSALINTEDDLIRALDGDVPAADLR